MDPQWDVGADPERWVGDRRHKFGGRRVLDPVRRTDQLLEGNVTGEEALARFEPIGPGPRLDDRSAAELDRREPVDPGRLADRPEEVACRMAGISGEPMRLGRIDLCPVFGQ